MSSNIRYLTTFTACFAAMSLGILLPIPKEMAFWMVGVGSLSCFTTILSWCVIPQRKWCGAYTLGGGIFGTAIFIPILVYSLHAARRTQGYDWMADVMTETCVSVSTILSALAIFYGLIKSRQTSMPNKAAEPSRTTVTPPAGAGDRASGAPGSP